MENVFFEDVLDVFPIQNVDFPLACWFTWQVNIHISSKPPKQLRFPHPTRGARLDAALCHGWRGAGGARQGTALGAIKEELQKSCLENMSIQSPFFMPDKNPTVCG